MDLKVESHYVINNRDYEDLNGCTLKLIKII
jgi:hypothetical protein